MKRITHIKMARVLLPVAFASALLAALMLVFAPGQFASALSPGTVLLVSPTNLTIPGVGYTGTNEIQVTDVFSLFYGVEYDEKVVQPVDADPYTPGVQIGVGPVFTDQAPLYFVARNWVYTDTGSVAFRTSLYSTALPFTGTGTVANVTWECLSKGQSPVTFAMSKLADYPDGHVIPHTVAHGTIDCQDGSELEGKILLQGRSDHSDTYVFVTIDPCPAPVQIASMDIPIPDLPSAVTDASGHFEIDLYPDRTGNDDYKCLQAFHHGYLVGQKDLPPYKNLGTITLLGGDATEDDCINIFDLALIAARYGTSDVTADVNGDDVVDIYDLVIAAGNYDKCGPQGNWQ
jgi:hypothetical protein